MHILVTAATAAELLPAQEVLETLCNQKDRNICVDVVETGIGSAATAYHTLKALLAAPHTYDLAVNIGVAGTFCNSLPIGSVVRVVSDYFGDCGIQTASGFESLFDARLMDADKFPFTSGKLNPAPLPPPWESALAHIPITHGVTVQSLVEEGLLTPHLAPPLGIETMEGAAFFYVCMNERTPCLALRAVSNRVGERDKSLWDIPLALSELRKTLTYLSARS